MSTTPPQKNNNSCCINASLIAASHPTRLFGDGKLPIAGSRVGKQNQPFSKKFVGFLHLSICVSSVWRLEILCLFIRKLQSYVKKTKKLPVKQLAAEMKKKTKQKNTCSLLTGVLTSVTFSRCKYAPKASRTDLNSCTFAGFVHFEHECKCKRVSDPHATSLWAEKTGRRRK